MHVAYQKIVEASGNRAELEKLYMELIVEKMKLDKFFSMFLDKFESKMDCEEPNTPIWKLYRTKHKEYGDIDQAVKAAQYYMKK
jgi:hypothetical protein